MTTIVPPGLQGTPFQPPAPVDLSGTITDSDAIAATAQTIDQKDGPSGAPDQPVDPTTVTAVDGDIVASNSTANAPPTRRSLRPMRRQTPGVYETVFTGSGTGPTDRDASIHGTAFLTFTTVDNSTYNIAACEAFCDGIETCGMSPYNPKLSRELSASHLSLDSIREPVLRA